MKLDHIVIALADIDQTIGFYEALLPLIGFSRERDHVFGNADGVYLDFRQAEFPEQAYHRYAPGLNHMGFTATDRDALHEVRRAMKLAGFDVPDLQHFSDGDALFFKDDEGMRIEVASYHESNESHADE